MVEERKQEGAEVSQAGEGYGCSCGFKTPSLREIRLHWAKNRNDTEQEHHSLGRINLQTGEVIMPPWKDRTTEQKKASMKSQRRGDGKGAPFKTTDILGNAQQIQFVPRVFTADYSPIMRAGQEAAQRYWGWRPDMPLGNFLDTVIYLFFREKGITLAGYIVSEEAQEALKQTTGGEGHAG